MVIIGIDPHKRVHVASAMEPTSHRVLGSMQVDATLEGYAQLARWAGELAGREGRRWAVENAHGLGRHLTQWLLARGERVQDVPAAATARGRQLSRGGRRKNDVIDAAAAASVAALTGEANAVGVEDLSTVLSMLDERRTNLTRQRTRLVNQLHALLRDLLPGGVDTHLSADKAAAALGAVEPVGVVETARVGLGEDLVAELHDTDTRLGELKSRMSEVVASSGSRLPELDGIGAIVATRLLGRVGRADRFPSCSAFANYAGVAPIEVASAGRGRHRLPRGGDRQLNSALHIIALTQIRMPHSVGRAYYDTKIAEGKTRNEAMRCLKRRLANRIWRIMIADQRPCVTPVTGAAGSAADSAADSAAGSAAGSGGHTGATLSSSAAGPTPTTSSSDKSLPEPAAEQPTTGSATRSEGPPTTT